MDARTSWDRGAEAWQDFVRSGADYYRLLVHGPALVAACQPVAARNVLDIGCGEGYLARELADAGARVAAIDFSPRQIRAALDEEARAPRGVEYRVADARTVAEHWTPGTFDLVAGCMSLQDMADAGTVMRGVASVLTRGGRFVFSVPHPGTDTVVREWERDGAGRKLGLKIDRYFDTGESVTHWNMPRLQYGWTTPHWRRTLQEWSELLAAAGFTIRRLLEPRPAEELVRAHPELQDCARVPYFLIFDACTGEPAGPPVRD